MNLNLCIAKIEDVPRLVYIENICFSTDKLSRRNFHYLIRYGKSETIIITDKKNNVLGYAIILYRRGASSARLYSIAVHPDFRGFGIAGILLREAEHLSANNHHCISLRLEVRLDNTPAIKLYESSGYHRFNIKHDYYEDHADAACYEKRIV